MMLIFFVTVAKSQYRQVGNKAKAHEHLNLFGFLLT